MDKPSVVKRAELTRPERFLRCVAVAMLFIYVTWQAIWLADGQLPPALFLALTGWPAPTTGGTRSLLALLAGDWWQSLYHNAMLLPIVAVWLTTIVWLAVHHRQLHKRSLPRGLVTAWVTVMTVAWLIKLLQAALGTSF